MSWFAAIWGQLFRLFPCPDARGLRRIGNPGRDSPVLVTGNFSLTLQRLRTALAGHDVWLVVANSKGINVWCAAGAGELSTRQVVAAVKVSRVADLVDHRVLILPPLAAPAVRAVDVAAATGFETCWGPVRATDLPAYLAAGRHRTTAMKRTSWTWRERLDTGLGTMFPFYLLGVIGFALGGRALLLAFTIVSLTTLLLFLLVAPWVPGRGGFVKALVLSAPLGLLLLLAGVGVEALQPWRSELIIALASLLCYGIDLGGMSSTRRSDFDPLVARLGIRRAFGIDFAGTVRTDLLLQRRQLACDQGRCIRCGSCVEICPLGVWTLPQGSCAQPQDHERCTACTACLQQCPVQAITTRLDDGVTMVE